MLGLSCRPMPSRRPSRRWPMALGLVALLIAPVAPRVYGEPGGTVAHVVEPGETLWQIAGRLGAAPATLTKLNALTAAAVISAGRRLFAPARPPPSAPAASSPPPPPAPTPPPSTSYTVAE